ncbi:MAG: glutamate-5-semialdehyde dehydrogenase [Candidatus Omnitrophota bacterium]|jgi:glutamate-5-semialdehyde dehydrogenase
MKLKEDLVRIARRAKIAYRHSCNISADIKNQALRDMAAALLAHQDNLIRENRKDLKAAALKKLKGAFLERLSLDEQRIKQMSDSLLEIAALADPVGEVIKAWRRPNGLWIHKVRVAIGVIAIIYESRPNVTSDCIGLCFKSGNSVILRGGSEAFHSNLYIYNLLRGCLEKYGVDEGMINMVTTTDRRAVAELLQLDEYIDLAMPRGGEGLIRKVAEISRIPVIKHYKGVCHVYVDKYADRQMAEKISFNAKVQRPGVCNAMECLLVHHDIAAKFLPSMIKKLKGAGVEIHGCPVTGALVKGVLPATKKDYYTEYLDLKLSVKVVKSLQEAIEHINHYGSGHSDSIVTERYENAMEFLRQVDSACVYVNASTRFTDGYQFGMGAEIGISTDKLHARGPMALEELTTYKYLVFGNGQVRK